MRYHRGAIRSYRQAPHRAGVPQPRTAVPADRAMATDLNGPGSGAGREIGTAPERPTTGYRRRPSLPAAAGFFVAVRVLRPVIVPPWAWSPPACPAPYRDSPARPPRHT